MTGGLFGELYGDRAMAAVMDDRAAVAAMLRAEAALAEAQAGLGIIPASAAQAISAATDGLCPDIAALAPGVAGAGIVAQPVIAALKAATPPDARGWVHYGATSQDIVDTGLSLQLQQALALLRDRLDKLAATLADRAAAFADLPVPARTRFQIAAPTTLGARIAGWRAPLDRHLERLDQLSPRLLNISLYGAAGTSAALGPQAGDVRRRMATALGLGAPDMPWHAARDGVVELAGWLSLVTGALGKMGADLILSGQSEVGELTAGAGGGSSTMPQKSNPVAAEALVTLARLNAGAVGTMHLALVHAQERDGTALGLEWQTLPLMLERTAAALRLALGLAETLAPLPERIAATFADDRGRMTAEAAGFLLSREMPRADAVAIVAKALRAVQNDPGETLTSALARLVPGRDWDAALDPAILTGDAPQQARPRQEPCGRNR